MPEPVVHEAATSTYDNILDAAKKMVAADAPAEEPKTVPADYPKATPVSESLLARGRELGMNEEEVRSAGEAGVGAAERALLRALRSREPEKKQDAKPVPPQVWESDEEKANFDPRVQKVLERLHSSATKHYETKITELESQIKQLTDFAREQVAEQGRSTIDRIGDKLSEEGFSEFGKGRARPGTKEHDAKVKLATILAAEEQAYRQAGLDFDLEAAARAHAERIYGKKAPAAPAETKKQTPAKDPVTGKFLPATTQFGKAMEASRTPTNRPTQHDEQDEAPSREKAVRSARAYFEANGNPLHDIHGE